MKVQVPVTLENVRLSFPKLGEPETTTAGHKKWGCALIIDGRKGAARDALVKRIQKAVTQVRKEAFDGKKVPHPLHKSEDRVTPLAGYDDGTFYLNVQSYKHPPRIVDNNVEEVSGDDDTMFYPGARVNVVLSFYAQSGRRLPDGCVTRDRVAVGLDGIQFCNHDERLGGSKPEASDLFSKVDVKDPPSGGEFDDDGEDDFSVED